MLAKRIGNLATNLLVTGLIVIVGVAFGREVISWWRSDTFSTAPPPISAVAGNHVPVVSADRQLLEFGDFPFVLNRQEFVGDVPQTLEQLRTACRAAVTSAEPLARDFGPAEQRMLDATQRLAPVEEHSNRWSIYQIDIPLPMVVGVRSFDPQVATAARRVVSWGLAVPDATPEGERQSEWTLFTYSSDTTFATTPERLSRPAPPGAERTLSLRTEQGGTIVGYAGFGTVESWTKFYEDLFATGPSPPSDRWQVDFGSWRRRFVSTEKETVDVVIRLDGDSTLRSFVITSPSR
ncbi:MAG TPA: hypothetical protein VMM76_16895 [Pirellulaceae bacterium]|nr:hypothetical protein [Pirellulaceae bacterium]